MSALNLEHAREVIGYLIALILSICVHEFGHAIVADKLGDPLPRAKGRVTLNPIAHMDPIGTLVMPLMQLIFEVPLIGWGKPVPVSLSARTMTRRFSIKTSHAFIAIAGPMMNILFAVVLSGLYLALLRYGNEGTLPFVLYVQGVIKLNILLAFFNMIPCPPLDGGAVLHGILPRDLEWITEWLKQYGFFILFALLATGVIGRLLIPGYWLFAKWIGFLHGVLA